MGHVMKQETKGKSEDTAHMCGQPDQIQEGIWYLMQIYQVAQEKIDK